MSSDTRPDRHALLELDALLDQVTLLRDEGDAARFDKDDRYRWMLHRLWIAAGNEALNEAVLRRVWRRLFLPRDVRRTWEQRFPDLRLAA